jgi:2-oxoglutarate dehydrogenase E1 component
MGSIDLAAIANPDYFEEQYRRYRADPRSVDERWALFFAGFEFAADGSRNGASAVERIAAVPEPMLGVYDFVHSYRELGHLVAHLNPLEPKPLGHPLLEPSEFGFGPDDLDRTIDFGSFRGAARGTLSELIERLLATYCGTLGVEYMHIPDREQRLWLQDRMEPTSNHPELARKSGCASSTASRAPKGSSSSCSSATRPRSASHSRAARRSFRCSTSWRTMPRRSASTRWSSACRIAGASTCSPTFSASPTRWSSPSSRGVSSPARRPATETSSTTSATRTTARRTGGQRIHLSLSANPSHLEAINPVVEGVARAKQDHMADVERGRVVPVLMHGDAAFTGQGVVAETLTLSELDGYRTGGTIHIIVNNQIGFTTPPEAYRFTPYPSDVAKIIQAPVFHVNGDDPEAAVQAARLAIGFRQRFKKDVIIDLVCYRRHGHNELDDPTFTQPVMYEKIAKHPTVTTLYRQRLVDEGVLSEDEATRRTAEFRELLDDAQAYARDFSPRQQIFVFGGLWKGFGWAGDDWNAPTAVSPEILHEVAETFVRVPDDFHAHPKAVKILESRHTMVTEGKGIDWACAEALAIGSLLLEKIPVRLSGQDTARGTFSPPPRCPARREDGRALRAARQHPRRAVAAGDPGQHALRVRRARVRVRDQHGRPAPPRRLGSAVRRLRQRRPDHHRSVPRRFRVQVAAHERPRAPAAARLRGTGAGAFERTARALPPALREDNLQVCNLSTPGQYFHALRRQMHRHFRKPLVIMSPKSLLRHKAAVSTLADLTSGRFETVLDDPAVGGAPEAGLTLDRRQVKRVLLCSGKIYYALLAARRERRAESVAIVRVEQLYPFPRAELDAIFASYPETRQVYWVQEEPQNMGAWLTTYPRLRRVVPEAATVDYVGRAEAASPAAGSYKMHGQEETEIVNSALARA